MENKISVVINTYNAELHLARVLEAVKDFDEILICDMESTDSTLEIAKKYGCKVVTFERKKYNIVEPAREYAIHEAKYPWVLVVDADEIVTSALREYLYQRISSSDCPEGLAIPRKNYFMGCFMRSHYPDYILRFFRQDKTHWPPIIHCAPEIDGRVERIAKSRKELAFEHLANDSVSDILRKHDTYSTNEVPRRRQKSWGVGAMLFRPLFRFVKSYIIKGGFLDGKAGLIQALLDAHYQFAVVAKLIEERQKKSNV